MYDSEKKLHNDFGSGISGLCVFSSKNTTSFVSTSFKSSTALASAVSMPFYYLLELQHKLDQCFFCGSEKIRLKKPAISGDRSHFTPPYSQTREFKGGVKW